MEDKELEKRFIKWAESRDDDWWEYGNGHISIWDVRVMLDFVKEEIKLARQNVLHQLEKIIREEAI